MNLHPRKTIFLVILLIVLMVGGLILWVVNFRLPKPVFYLGFGVVVPSNFKIVGIDVSKYQHHIFWKEVGTMTDQQRSLSFVFIKATEGESGVDKAFASNWKSAGKCGLSTGAYHYFHPNQSAVKQADNFLKNVVLHNGNLRPVLDIEVLENSSVEQLRDSICQWMSVVGNTYKTTPIIYTNAAFYNQYLMGYFDDYPLWIAHYKTSKPNLKTDFQFWQITDAGWVNGIPVNVDFNVFNGDILAFERMKLKLPE